MVFSLAYPDIAQTAVSVTELNAKITAESEKLQARLNDLAARYDAVVLAKSNLEKKHAQSEEQNLVYKKAILESQIEVGKLADQSDSQNFSLTNQVIALQNECMESGQRIDSLLEENTNLKSESSQIKQENINLSMEFDVLKANFSHLEKDHQSTLRKLEEMGVELVNLVNTKGILLAEKESKMSEIEKIQKQFALFQQLAILTFSKDWRVRKRMATKLILSCNPLKAQPIKLIPTCT